MVKIINMHYKHLEVQAECPKCGEHTITNSGNGFVPDLQKTKNFWCDEHGEFAIKLNWGKLFEEFVGSKEEPL